MTKTNDGSSPWSVLASDRCCEIHQDLNFPGVCEDCIEWIAEEARAEGYADGLREGQERMRERIENMPMPEKDWIGSLYEKGWKGGWRAYSAAIRALEVEDS